MPRSHFSSKHCFAMTGGFVAAAMLLFYCLYGTVLFSSATPTADTADDTLQLLHVVFRHGPRTPASTYPRDPYNHESFYPYGRGHLTNDGKRELYNIGSWLRKRYIKFLGAEYHPDLLYAKATGVERTIMSMQTVLASFFPPKNTAMSWNEHVNWQPIPVFSEPLDQDTLLLVRTPCPRYFEALDEVLVRPEVKKEIAPYVPMMRELTELTGWNITGPEDVQSLYLTLLAEQEFGLKLPVWTQHYFPQRMQFLTEQSYIYNVYTEEMQKIKGGPFLAKMFGEWHNKQQQKLEPSERKLYIYTGHDSTVVNILSALQIWQRQLPRYSVMALFELHKRHDSNEYYVEIYMRNEPEGPAEPLTIPGCDFQCPLEQLYMLTANVVPGEDDTQRCDSKDSTFREPPLRGP